MKFRILIVFFTIFFFILCQEDNIDNNKGKKQDNNIEISDSDEIDEIETENQESENANEYIEISEDKSIYQTCSGSFTVKYSDDYQSNVEFFQNYLQTSFQDNIEFNTEDNDNRIIVKFNVKKKGSYSVSLPMMINSEDGYGTSIATMYIKCE